MAAWVYYHRGTPQWILGNDEAAAADEPLFLFVGYNAPHYPMHAPKEYMDRFAHLPWDRQVMAAMLAAVARLQRDGIDTLPELWKLVSQNPAEASGLSDRGRIEPGKRADLVLLDWPEGAAPWNY